MVAITSGAVAELQLRIGNIRAATDRAFVGIGRFDGGSRSLVRAGIGKYNRPRPGFRLSGRLLLKEATGINTPAHGNHIQHILAEEEEIIGQRHQGEQIMGEAKQRIR